MNHPTKYQLAKELVAIVGTMELVLGVYIGFLFGAQETWRAWLFVGILGVVTYTSTRLWIWVMEQMNKK